MSNIFFPLASFLIAEFAFGFGAAKLFKKNKPLYLQILVCAAGCFALQQLSYMVNIWCDVTSTVSIGMFGIFGCNFFLLSANFGTLDKIVDDCNESDQSRAQARARACAVIAPIVMAVLAILTFLTRKNEDMFCAVMWLVMLIPALPASYFNLKHILLPMDPSELLRTTKPCNLAALAFYIVTAVYAIFSKTAGSTITGILCVAMSCSILALSLCAVRGAKKWGI